ncbi:uncharacterized protein MEPE_00226 [Melanopsichium pennsylvanicum]|uniref:Kinetochore protein Spc24 n=1 Tax=Melanopsichium pennsylvanicum TaxID=63383 RepID=A0AAJ4XGX9_9BASI|nr:uncharacterized protein MEPE_00226 [Melanopsichium pennsylvanicum]
MDASSVLMPHPSTIPTTTNTTAVAINSTIGAIDEARLTDDDIDSLIASLSPTSELDHLRSIEKTIRETQSRRKREEEANRAKIHALESSLNELRKQSTRQAADWRSLAQHAETIEKLDNRNFDLAKKINEQEGVLNGMQTQVLELKRLMEECEAVDVEDSVEMDKDASLGFLPSKSSSTINDTNGETQETSNKLAMDQWSSILVRSDTRNTAIQFDIQSDHLNHNHISPLVLADQLWKAAE